MAFCTPQELVEASHLGKIIHYYDDAHAMYPLLRRTGGPVTLERARAIIRSVKETTLKTRQGKINRPFELVPLQSRLDPDQPWIGWEIECGWANQESYHEVVEYIWNYHRHVTIDTEGHGNYPSEITFPPQNADKMFSGKAQVHRFLKWVARREDVIPSYWTTRQAIGTHLNISTPKYRELCARTLYNSDIAPRISSLLRELTDDQKQQLFGRRNPYGYAYSNGQGANSWIEFKLFHSTLNPAQFAGYCRVAERMTKLVDYFCDPDNSDDAFRVYGHQLSEGLRDRLSAHYVGVNWRSLRHKAIINVYEFLSGQNEKLLVVPDLVCSGMINQEARALMSNAE